MHGVVLAYPVFGVASQLTNGRKFRPAGEFVPCNALAVDAPHGLLEALGVTHLAVIVAMS